MSGQSYLIPMSAVPEGFVILPEHRRMYVELNRRGRQTTGKELYEGFMALPEDVKVGISAVRHEYNNSCNAIAG